MARTDPAIERCERRLGVHRRARHAGLTVGKPDRKMGQRGAHTADVIFDNARVPAEKIIGGKEGVGFKTAMKVLDKARLNIAAVCVGAADAHAGGSTRLRAGAQAVRAADRRIPAGAGDARGLPDRDLRRAQHDARSRAHAATPAATSRMEAACCKYFASEMCGRVADRAVQIHGGAGYMADSPIERFYRDVRLFRLYEGTSQIQQLIIARNMIRNAGR